MDTHSLLDEYKETKDCLYKGEHYSVRDNGAVFRHAQNPSKPRKHDNRVYDHRKPQNTHHRCNSIPRQPRFKKRRCRPYRYKPLQQQTRQPAMADKIGKRAEQPRYPKKDNLSVRR